MCEFWKKQLQDKYMQHLHSATLTNMNGTKDRDISRPGCFSLRVHWVLLFRLGVLFLLFHLCVLFRVLLRLVILVILFLLCLLF